MDFDFLKEIEIPDELGTISGWRFFNFNDAARLTSYNSSFMWSKGVNQAVCYNVKREKAWINGPDCTVVLVDRANHGTIPDPDCGCGFWIYNSLSKAKSKFGVKLPPLIEKSSGRKGKAFSSYGDFSGNYHRGYNPFYICGKVEGWGKILEGVDGWRSEFARVLSLIVYPKAKELIEEIAKNYDADLISLDQVSEILDSDVKKVKGIVVSIGPLEKSLHTGRYRPIKVTFDNEQDVYIWKNNKLLQTIRDSCAESKEIELNVFENEWMGYKKLMVEDDSD